jgi:hypothetical protein
MCLSLKLKVPHVVTIVMGKAWLKVCKEHPHWADERAGTPFGNVNSCRGRMQLLRKLTASPDMR